MTVAWEWKSGLWGSLALTSKVESRSKVVAATVELNIVWIASPLLIPVV